MIERLIYFVVYVIVLGVVVWLLRWIMGQVPMDEPFRRVANIAIVVLGVVILIALLLQLAGIALPVR